MQDLLNCHGRCGLKVVDADIRDDRLLSLAVHLQSRKDATGENGNQMLVPGTSYRT